MRQVKKAKKKKEESPWAFNPFQKYQNHVNNQKLQVRAVIGQGTLQYILPSQCILPSEEFMKGKRIFFLNLEI